MQERMLRPKHTFGRAAIGSRLERDMLVEESIKQLHFLPVINAKIHSLQNIFSPSRIDNDKLPTIHVHVAYELRHERLCE